MNAVATTRTFGIEIETTVPPSASRTLNFDHGWPSGQDIPNFPGWTTHGDGSIYPGSGRVGVEIVSPILSGKDGLAQVKRMLALLSEIGAQPNTSTGLHVHVGVADLTELQIRSVRRAFVRYEHVFLALNGEDVANRRTSHWCRLSNGERPRRELQQNRYYALNLSNWIYWKNCNGRSGKPTLECRVWQSTLSEKRVVAAVSFFVALVARAAAINARTAGRIANPTEAAQEFVRAHYGKGIRSLDLRIDPDESAEPIYLGALQDIEQGARLMGYA